MPPMMGPFNTVPTGLTYVLQSTGVNGDIVLAPFNGASGILSASGIASASGIPTGLWAPTGTLSASGIVSGSGIKGLTGLWAPSGTLSASGIASASGIPTGLWAATGVLSASGIVSATGAAGGDLSGSYPNPVVVGLRGNPLLSAVPQPGQFLGWDGFNANWKPISPSSSPSGLWAPSGTLSASGIVSGSGISQLTGLWQPSGASAGGDLGGKYPNPIVVALRGNPILSATPQAGQVLGWDGFNANWLPISPSGPTGIYFSNNGVSLGNFQNVNLINSLYGVTGANNAINIGASGHNSGQQALIYTGVMSGISTGFFAFSIPTATPAGNAGGDLAGKYPNPIVAALRGNPLAVVTPQVGQILGWDAFNANWTPVTPSGFSQYSTSTYMNTGFNVTGTNFYALGTMVGTCTIGLPTGQLAAAGTRYTITDALGTLSTPTNMVLISAPSGWTIEGITGFLLTTPRTTIDVLSVATFIWKIV